MDIIWYILIAAGGLIALWLIFKFLGGCLLKILIAVAILALLAFLVFSVIRC